MAKFSSELGEISMKFFGPLVLILKKIGFIPFNTMLLVITASKNVFEL